MKLYFFNPGHDEVLVWRTTYATPSKAACGMERDLCYLAGWYADKGDAVWVSSLDAVCQLKSLTGNLFPDVVWTDSFSELPVTGAEPWGWDDVIKFRLSEGGVPSELLPSISQLDRIQELSSRKQAVVLLNRLKENLSCQAQSWFCESEEEVKNCVESLPSSILKAPWSGSGRGLRRGFGVYDRLLSGWCRNLLRRQGGIEIEPFYDKVMDFAMEFYADGTGKVCYTGLSLFDSAVNGAYTGNRIASETHLWQELEKYIDGALLTAVRTNCQRELGDILGTYYKGFLGVDMMLCRGKSGGWVHPCVEINLRRTMGYVACRLNSLIQPDAEARMIINYHSSPGDLKKWQQEQLVSKPLRIVEGHYSSGYLPLTPIASNTHFHAFLISEP